MTRWVEEHWGDEIDVVSLSGGTFSFFGYGLGGRNLGLVNENRKLTQSYKWLAELSKLFSVSGFVIQDNRVYDDIGYEAEVFLLDPDNKKFADNHPREGMIKERLYMNLVFDYISCYGYLDAFDVSESSTSPYRMTYSLVFKSEKTEYRQGSPYGAI
jgi:hypothetical protein